MPKIRCHYLDCEFLDDRYCCAAGVEFSPEAGCMTFKPAEDSEIGSWEDDLEDEWDENEREDSEDLYAAEDDEADDEGEDEIDEY